MDFKTKEVQVTKYGVFFEDDVANEQPLHEAAFMTLAEAWALINEGAYAWTGRKLVVRPVAAKMETPR